MLGAHAAEANALGCRLKVVGFNPIKIMCVKEKYVMLATCAAQASVFKCRLKVVSFSPIRIMHDFAVMTSSCPTL